MENNCANRRRLDHHPLKQIQWHANIMGDDQANYIGVRENSHDLVRMLDMNALQHAHRPILRFAQGFAPWKAKGAGEMLHTWSIQAI